MFNNELWQKPTAGAADFYTHQIANSCRLDGTGYLTDTRSSDGSTNHATISIWFKRAALGSYQYLLETRVDGNNYVRLTIQADDTIEFQGEVGAAMIFELETTQVFRDTSAWYHFVGVLDLDNSTQADRAQMYINGERVTAFDTATYPSDTSKTMVLNTSDAMRLGATGYDGSNDYNGYLAEVVVIDGTAQAITDMGTSKNGVWIPDDPSSLTFGTNGFYLKFESSSDLGNDSSGNNHDFTLTNISTHDQMLDSPTFNSSSNGGNYCTLNSIYPDITVARINDCNLAWGGAAGGGSVNEQGCMSTFAISPSDTNIYYFEARMKTGYSGGIEQSVGVNVPTVDLTSDRGGRPTAWAITNTDYRRIYKGDNSYDQYTGTGSAGDIVGVEIDRANTTIKFYIDGTLIGSATNLNTTTDLYPWVGTGGSTSSDLGWDMNFGQNGTFNGLETAQGESDATGYGDFYYDEANSCKALCAGNLPVAAEVDPAQTDDNYPQKLFSPLIWTGNDATSRAITGLGFRPDWLWFKNRSSAYSNRLYDTSRGIASNGGKRLFSNTNAAETDQTSGQDISAVGSDGFTMGASSGLYNNDTGSGGLQVGWFWRANGGTTSSGSGDLTSTHQVDPSGGFSIVLATGDGGSGDKTVSHGLSATPTVILAKKRSGASNWDTYFSEGVTAGSGMRFNTDEAPLTGRWGTINSSIMTCKDNYTWYSTDTFVYYCFTNIEGYIKAGTYVGNANADGTFVYTGFKPAFFMCKPIVTGNWRIQDIKRSPYNVADETLFPNHSNAEQSNSSDSIDILSNGVKMRASDSDYNQATTFVYLAMAHNPFKYATAR
jgi:hypothetical protein